MAKKSVVNLKNKAEFVRQHVQQRLVRAGWSEEKAADMVAEIDDGDIQEYLPEDKMRGPGSGKWLDWIKEHKEEILEGVEKIFNLLSLFAEKPA